jgi:hypothetical protein
MSLENAGFDEPIFLTEGRQNLNKELAKFSIRVPSEESRQCCQLGATTHRLPDGRDFCKPCAKLEMRKMLNNEF